MSRLNLESLNAVFVDEAIETLTWFFTPGEGKQNKKGDITYSKKKETRDGKKVDVDEEYLQLKRSEDAEKQILSFHLKEEKVAEFIFTSQGVDFITTPKWKQPKMYVCLPTDPTFNYIVAEELSGVFLKWLKTKRFEDYLERQAEDSKYTTAFVKLILFFFAWSENRDKTDSNGNTTIIKDGVDLNAVAHSYTKLLTKLHNSSDRAKKLFPIRPMLSPAQLVVQNPIIDDTTTIIRDVLEEANIPIVEVISELESTLLATEAESIPVEVIPNTEKVETVSDPAAKTLENIAKAAKKK